MIPLVARLSFPFSLAVAAALLVKGYAAIGDGFAAGAIAGLGAVSQFACLDHEHAARICGARHAWRLLWGGVVLALAVALAPLVVGAAPVTHLPAPGAEVAKVGSLELHTAVLFDLGIALLVYGAITGTFDRLFPALGEERG